ncbi:MAG TPA: hypothetical protein VFI46_07830 [Jiangellaceae bacterium]|nr:hypothetical protein [Jiangellaceae bacterium]
MHTLAWLSIESCVLYVLYAGFAGRTDKRVGIAGAIVVGETLVFAANGFRCPLTELAERRRERLGDRHLPAEMVRAQHAGHSHTTARPDDVPVCTEPATVASDSERWVAPATALI